MQFFCYWKYYFIRKKNVLWSLSFKEKVKYIIPLIIIIIYSYQIRVFYQSISLQYHQILVNNSISVLVRNINNMTLLFWIGYIGLNFWPVYYIFYNQEENILLHRINISKFSIWIIKYSKFFLLSLLYILIFSFVIIPYINLVHIKLINLIVYILLGALLISSLEVLFAVVLKYFYQHSRITGILFMIILGILLYNNIQFLIDSYNYLLHFSIYIKIDFNIGFFIIKVLFLMLLSLNLSYRFWKLDLLNSKQKTLKGRNLFQYNWIYKEIIINRVVYLRGLVLAVVFSIIMYMNLNNFTASKEVITNIITLSLSIHPLILGGVFVLECIASEKRNINLLKLSPVPFKQFIIKKVILSSIQVFILSLIFSFYLKYKLDFLKSYGEILINIFIFTMLVSIIGSNISVRVSNFKQNSKRKISVIGYISYLTVMLIMISIFSSFLIKERYLILFILITALFIIGLFFMKRGIKKLEYQDLI